MTSIDTTPICEPDEKHNGLFVDAIGVFELHRKTMGFEVATAICEQLYGLGLPSVDLLDAIASWAPLIDVGAGNGYLSFLLQRRGVDIIPIDIAPAGGKHRNQVFVPESPCWTTIHVANARDIGRFGPRTPLLAWPMPEPSPMASTTLRCTRSNRLIYIGDDNVCGDDNFHEDLRTHWSLVRTVPLPPTARGLIPARFYERRSSYDRSR